MKKGRKAKLMTKGCTNATNAHSWGSFRSKKIPVLIVIVVALVVVVDVVVCSGNLADVVETVDADVEAEVDSQLMT